VQLVQSVTPRTQGAFVSQLMDGHLHALPDSPQLVVTFRDMGWAWQKLRDNHLSSSALEAISEAVMITDPQGLIVRVNRAFTDLTGYSAEDVVDQTPRILKSGRHDREFYRDLWNHLLSRGSWAGEVWDKAKSGRIYPKWISIFSVYEGRRLAYYVSIFFRSHGEAQPAAPPLGSAVHGSAHRLWRIDASCFRKLPGLNGRASIARWRSLTWIVLSRSMIPWGSWPAISC